MTQTRAAQQEEWKALEGVRGALRGWAFADAKGLRGRIAAAEIQLAHVPDKHKQAAQNSIDRVRVVLAVVLAVLPM